MQHKQWMVAMIIVSSLAASSPPAFSNEIDYVGSPAWHMPDLTRARTRPANERTIARAPVTRSDYVDFCRPMARAFRNGPDRGPYGPRHALPALAVAVHDGDIELAEGVKKTLRHYADWVAAEIARQGGVFSLEGPALSALYLRELRNLGVLTPADEKWGKELILNFRRYHFAWRPNDGLWRGQHHRSQTQGIAHALAAALYPDVPDADRWQAYADRVWNDWWAYRDVGINDTSYYFSSLCNVLLAAELLGHTEVFTDPEMQSMVWTRMVHEATPDGVAPPYGSHGGYNCHAGHRVFALELAARHSRDGRYRWVAQRLMNFANASGGFSPGHHHLRAVSEEHVALAALFCDDTVKPIEPDGASRFWMRKEIERLTNAEVRERFPDADGLDCNMAMRNTPMPDKLALRAGWDPGDLYMLIECYARHDPLNPTAILSLERHGAAFAMPTSEKFVSRENAVRIEDLDGNATFCGRRGDQRPRALPLGYDGMHVSVPVFSDHAAATHARIEVSNYMGYEATHERELLFVKNQFVLVRDETAFHEAFTVRIGPTWNTQNIGAAGAHWLDTWFSKHYFQRAELYDNPPWNLLIVHAPHPDRRLAVTGRWDESTIDVPYSAQYAWEGPVANGDRRQFVQIYLPHHPGMDAAGLAERVIVLHDEPGAAAAFVPIDNGGGLLALLNRDGGDVNTSAADRGAVPAVTTDARALYMRVRSAEGTAAPSGRVQELLVIEGTYVTLDDHTVFEREHRTTIEHRGP